MRRGGGMMGCMCGGRRLAKVGCQKTGLNMSEDQNCFPREPEGGGKVPYLEDGPLSVGIDAPPADDRLGAHPQRKNILASHSELHAENPLHAGSLLASNATKDNAYVSALEVKVLALEAKIKRLRTAARRCKAENRRLRASGVMMMGESPGMDSQQIADQINTDAHPDGKTSLLHLNHPL